MKSIPLRQWEAAAYAAGRLTQLRRVCKPQPEVGRYGNGEIIGKVKNQLGCGDYYVWKSKTLGTIPLTTDCIYQLHRTSPYGAPGDTLALREAWGITDCGGDHYCIDYMHPFGAQKPLYDPEKTYDEHDPLMPDQARLDLLSRLFDTQRGNWRSSTCMPLWAVRWHPVITAVRLERVQDATEADARACGIGFTDEGPLHWHTMIGDWWVNRATHKEAAQDLWNHLNPRTPWKDNPWTWVYEVEGVTT